MEECKCPTCGSIENIELGHVGLRIKPDGYTTFHPRVCLECGTMYIDKKESDNIRKIKKREIESKQYNES